MSVFILTYIFSTFFAYLYSVEKDKYIACMLKICLFMSLFLPLALRYDIGTDYINYSQQIAWDVNPIENKWGGFEFGWRPLLWFIKTFEIDVHYFFVIVAFLSVLLVLNIVEKKYAYFAIVIYVSTLYLDSFSLIRQAFAALIAFYGVASYYKKDNKRYLIFVFIACLFHSSMYFLLVLLPLFLFMEKVHPLSKKSVIFLFFFIYVFFMIVNIPKIVFSVIVNSVFSGMSRYFTDELYGSTTKLGTGLGVLLKEFTTFPFIFFITYCNKRKEKNKFFMPALMIHSLIIVTYIFSTQITILNRLPYIFTSYFLISINFLGNSKSKYRKIILLLVVIIFTTNFIVNLIKNPSAASGGLGITPYQSIFSR